MGSTIPFANDVCGCETNNTIVKQINYFYLSAHKNNLRIVIIDENSQLANILFVVGGD